VGAPLPAPDDEESRTRASQVRAIPTS
jgi:hypothetical protein